jgi:nitrogen fixation protein NifB
MEMSPEYDLATRQEVQEGIEKFRAELKAAKAVAQESNSKPVKENVKVLVAVATKGGGLVNQHFGHAKEFQIYEVDGSEVKYVGHRKVGYSRRYQVKKIGIYVTPVSQNSDGA